MAKSVKIDVDAATGSLSVAEGALFLGERVPIVFNGYAPDTGNTLRLTLFAKDGITPLADNHSNANVLDLGYEKLRDAFGGKRIPVATAGQFRYEQENQWSIPFSASVIELTANGSAVGILARGSINVVWSPYVIDPVSGAPATLKGDRGDKGEKGDKGDKGEKGEEGDSAVDYVAAEVAKEAARAKAAEELNAKAAANAKKAIDTHTANTDNPHGVTAAQIGSYTKDESDTKLAAKADKSTTLAGYGITDAATKASLAPEYSAISAYSVGAIVYHDGNIYQCKTEISDGGEAWNAEHWELMKLDDFFTESTGFTPPINVAGALKNSILEKSIVLAVTENFADADTTSYGSAT